jgi:hypothetical protein
MQLGEQPRSAMFGEAFTAGSLVDGFNYGGKYGTDWECLLIRLADHKCEGLTSFYVNDELIPTPATAIIRSSTATQLRALFPLRHDGPGAAERLTRTARAGPRATRANRAATSGLL